uniref:Uncharacterized protein MANES_18G076200 n=1 Tax=Rhizophora mucronata TaxID=61149 RepID=A0A2P2MDK9_RHIMU
MEDSTVTGLLTGQKATKRETKETSANRNKEEPSEGSIKKALWKRASYINANSDKITMEGLRRLLEEDLKLNTYTLDPFKKFISMQLDEVLKSSEVSAPKKTIPSKSSLAKAAKQVSSEESSDSSDKESDEEDEDEVRPRKKIGSKQKMLNSEGSKKRKRPEKETKASAKKQIKAETVSEGNSDVENGANASEDSLSQSSAEKPAKKKESPTQDYGKHVEHLKSVIKSCGMSVPPSVYKKVKQVSDNKREAQLIKELEDILSREGLSSKPSEKEIKEVRKRKERAKELEGIDTSNIVLSSRRRSTASYAPPPKPKVLDESDSDDSDEDDDEDNEEDDVNDDEADGDIDNNDDGESEKSEEDNDKDSD